MRNFNTLLCILTLLLVHSGVFPQLQPSLLIQSGMVVQREVEIPLWGTGDPGQKVFATFNGMSDSCTTDDSGNWYLELGPQDAGGPYEMFLSSGEDTLRIQEVYVGDVWIASGQSNMAMTLSNSLPPDSTLGTEDNQRIRHFNVKRTLLNDPVNSIPQGSQWKPAFSEYTGDFSAVAYYFSIYLNAHLEIPVGIINASFGGTRIESWMSDTMLGFDESDVILGDGTSWLQPTVAYNAMIHPVKNVRARGFIWYQGESNAGSREDAVLYSTLFQKMIVSWRSIWKMGDLPFLWVQLPNFNTPANEDQPGTWDAWPLLRQSQSNARKLPNTEEAIAIDLGEVDIHPLNKQPVGERLYRIAKSMVYGDTIPYSGPRYLSHRLLPEGKVEILFDHIEGGLIARNATDQHLRWFSIVRSNGSIVPAEAVIDSNKVIVWNSTVSDPYAVRYAWETNPENVNFYNQAGLPAAPFYIYTENQGFSIKTYTSGMTHFDRGESTILRWETFGSDSITLNGIPVGPIDAMRVRPLEDSVFRLVINDMADPGHSIERTIKIFVRQPIPKIEISANSGQIIPLDSSVQISSIVSAEGGAPIHKVLFYINDQLEYEDISAPWEFTWKADTVTFARIHAIVRNTSDVSSRSNELTFDVRDLIFSRYEAENARYAPGLIKVSTAVSNGKYVDLMSNWTLDFDSVLVHDNGLHLIYFRYLLNYGSPRVQVLVVNDTTIGTVMFESPDLTTWMDYRTTVPLDSGLNKITIDGLWDYMCFDYIDVGLEKSTLPVDTVETDTTVSDTSGTGINRIASGNALQFKCYPNPVRDYFVIDMDVPENGPLTVRISDIWGRNTEELYDGIMQVGKQSFIYRPHQPNGGIHILQIIYNGSIYTRKLLLHSSQE